jgi:soluble lytic murein transglycosylase
MRLFWETITPGRWPDRGMRLLGALLLLAGGCAAQGLESLAHAYRDKPGKASRTALERFAASHPSTTDGALARLVLGIAALEEKQPAEAMRLLAAARSRLPILADYIGHHLAAAALDAGDSAAALGALEAVWRRRPSSPLANAAALLAARAQRDNGAPAEAAALLKARYAELDQPAADLLLASCYRAANDLANAVVYYQRVYYFYPAAEEAAEAAEAMEQLRTALGDLFPPATGDAMLRRAQALAEAGQIGQARDEYSALVARLGGRDRDLARVRVGVMDFRKYQNITAFNYLKRLDVEGEPDAERLYYLLECARRLDRLEEAGQALAILDDRHATSEWRLRALVSMANQYLLENQADRFVPLYRACYESFPKERRAVYCHWKVAWNTYVTRAAGASEMLAQHLALFPGSEHASASLYYLGRLSEERGEPGAAKGYYAELVERFPNYYYADLAARRLLEPALFKVPASQEVTQSLKAVVWPLPAYIRGFDPAPDTSARIERARLLNRAGLDALAERELRHGAANDGQPHVLAVHLVKAVSKYDEPHRALQLVKSLVPGYLAIPLDEAPASFWRLLFPLPYRTQLERYAKANGLDPFLVAGLIRQESEFNPRAVSRARAYGLTQILPSTGRSLLKMSRRRFRASILFRPEVNLRLGTTYLRSIYDRFSSRWELALASYNAGGSRVDKWLSWGEYREPAEFIETIPFTETRTYVYAVLRNASIYRKLYDGEGKLARPATVVRKAAPKSPAKPKRAVTKKKSSVRKRR